ncbi:hypothetical protein D3C81_1612360 [compost metagenome]
MNLIREVAAASGCSRVHVDQGCACLFGRLPDQRNDPVLQDGVDNAISLVGIVIEHCRRQIDKDLRMTWQRLI